MTTQERIAAKALELFNNKGIEYTGMREIAAKLGTKLGNITYYFPTKKDLIIQVSANLAKANSAILQKDESITMKSYFEMTIKHFECQYHYRCLFLSFVHLIKQYPKLSARYKKTELLRKKSIMEKIKHLVKNKYLRKMKGTEIKFLVSAVSILSRFWISEAAISYSKLKPANKIKHYISLLANIYLPYCTSKGKNELREFIENKERYVNI
ncbi:MAG: TetR family transcriptional regulator [Ignavibacteria bacterium]|nr:TetR family transcriptional regulator [Ignavibacteria bacterium]